MSTEERRIRSIVQLLKKFPAKSAAGLDASIGLLSLDDCAVVPMDANTDLVVGSDFIRGAGFHLFKKGVLSWRDIGYYLMGANASDLAAMGASPLGAVVVLRYTTSMSDRDYEEIMAGVLEACADFEMPLLGGDSGGYELPVLSATALGTCLHGKALLRCGGRAGDTLFVTGDVGLAGAALAYFTRAREEGIQFSADDEEELAKSWRHVAPALKQGRLLVDLSLSQCGIDTSDGLKASCRQLAEASKLDAVLWPDKIPVAPLATQVADALNVNALALAMGDSVDFRLVFSARKDLVERVRHEFKSRDLNLFEIGEFREPKTSDLMPGVYFQLESGLAEVPGVEWAQSEVMSIDQLRKESLPK